jgi:hypothetical protein
MKKLIYALFLTLLVLPVKSQKLTEIYKSGTVRLIPDTEYAQNNDWENVFRTYYDTLYGKPMGNRKSLLVLADGSVVVNHAYKNYYTKFNPDGTFEKEFSIHYANGKPLTKTKQIEGVLNDSILFTGLDNMGNMICCDLDGRYIKSLKLDYMTHQMIGLPDNKIAVEGWVIWKTKFRDFVALVDYTTNEQKIIWDHFTDRTSIDDHQLFTYKYSFKKRGIFSTTTMPCSKKIGLRPSPKIEFTGNHLVIALPTNGDIMVYDLDGNKVSSDRINWERGTISVEEQKEIQKKAIEKYKSLKNPVFANWVSPEENKEALNYIITKMEEDLPKISEPIVLPAFSTIIKDSDGNLLFFEFPEEKDANKFNVWIYQQDGKFVCQSSFVCDDYNLEINPDKMFFHDGYIYGLQKLKNSSGMPLRLVRFSLNKNE